MGTTENEVEKGMKPTSSEKEQESGAAQKVKVTEVLKKLKLEHIESEQVTDPSATLLNEEADPNTNPLNEIEKVQNSLLEMHTNLNNMIASLKADPSTLIWLVNKWNQADLPQRILWLVIGAAPLAAIGAAVGSSVLTAMAVTNTVALTTAGSLADQHIHITSKNEREFKRAVENLSAFLTFAITTLTETQKNLKIQVTRFTKQNNLYQKSMAQLSGELHEVRNHLIAMAYTKDLLAEQQEQLKQTIDELQKAKKEDQTQIAKKEIELKKLAEEQKRCHEIIIEEQKKFTQLVQEPMEKEIVQLKTLTDSLTKTIEVLSNNQITAKDHEEFQKKLSEAVTTNSVTVKDGFKQASDELQSVKKELEDYKAIFSDMITRATLDDLLKNPDLSARTLADNSVFTDALKSIGFFAVSSEQKQRYFEPNFHVSIST